MTFTRTVHSEKTSVALTATATTNKGLEHAHNGD